MAKQPLKLPTSKAISVWQPWGWAIIHAGKDIENRTWRTHYRGEILIHASKTQQQFSEDASWIREALGVKVPPRQELPFGAIVGHAELIYCVYSELGDGRWGQPGAWHWHLRNPRSLAKPIPYRGHQGFFNVRL